MANESFLDIAAGALDELAAECAGEGGPFLPRLGEVASIAARLMRLGRTWTPARGGSIEEARQEFNGGDMPSLLCVAGIVGNLAELTEGRQRSKRSVLASIMAALSFVHDLQHGHLGVPARKLGTPHGAASLRVFSSRTCAAELTEVGRAGREDIVGLAESYRICADFFREEDARRAKFPSGYAGRLRSGKAGALSPDAALALARAEGFVTEMPRCVCPRCGHEGWPMPDVRRFDEAQGFAFFCLACGNPCGWGGARKHLYEGGKRVAGTAWTAARLRRDACEICGRPGSGKDALQAHHVRPLSEGGEDVPSNVLVLCAECHAWIHARRDGLAKGGKGARIIRFAGAAG